jgi:hypothetical protein
MKRIAYTTYAWCATSIISVSTLIFMARATHAHLFTINNYTLSIDSRLTTETHTAIANTVTAYLQLTQQNPANLPALADQLQMQFNCIQSIDIARAPSKYAHIEVHAHTPYVRFENNENQYIASTNGIIMPCALFKTNITDGLRTIKIALNVDAHKLPDTCMQFMQQLPLTIFETYIFNWHNQYHIELNKKNNPTFSLLLSHHSILTASLMNYCNMLYEHLENNGAFAEKKKKHWIADVRFKDQIILSTHKGG